MVAAIRVVTPEATTVGATALILTVPIRVVTEAVAIQVADTTGHPHTAQVRIAPITMGLNNPLTETAIKKPPPIGGGFFI
jgi:hypothetical protein